MPLSARIVNTFIQPKNDAAALAHLPFLRETFLELMAHFQLPHSFRSHGA